VKNLLNGFICTCLLVIAGTLPGRAQVNKPDPQPVAQTAPAPTIANAPPQAPVVPAPAVPPAQPDDADADQQTPPAQTAPQQQTPPAGQTQPTGQVPVPPPAEDQPTPKSLVPQPPPPPPKVPDVRRPGESGFWVGVEGWLPKEQPYMNGGTKWPVTVVGGSEFSTLRGKPKYAGTVEVGAAVGLHNTLKFTATEFGASGDYTTPTELTLWNHTYNGNTYISTNYNVKNFKLSYEYLTWPYPVGSRKIRLKTLWQAQVTSVASTFDAPMSYYDSNGNLLLDSNGQPINLVATGTKRIISPEFGLGLSYYPTRHVRFELTGTGFGFPHHYYIWDSEAVLSYRFLKHFEIRLGGKGFGFKTSTDANYYIKGNYLSGFFGLRWYSLSE
jgi:hypothetical protein